MLWLLFCEFGLVWSFLGFMMVYCLEVDGYHAASGRGCLHPAPVLGVLSQPAGVHGPENVSYFAASYAKYVAMAGARVVPVLCDARQDELAHIFNRTNGLIVPGGAQDLRSGNLYYDAMSFMTDLAMQLFDRSGEVYPIHFTCLGWEAVAVKITNDPYILSNFTGTQGIADTLTWQPGAIDAPVLSQVPRQVLQAVESIPLTYEAHSFGIWLPDFEGTRLRDFFELLSTSRDSQGKVYVSTVVARRYPFVGVQWHPEKNPFEWGAMAIPHSLDAIQLAQGLANEFVQWARLSTHQYPDEELSSTLLYNYQPVADAAGYFDQVYVFPLTSR